MRTHPLDLFIRLLGRHGVTAPEDIASVAALPITVKKVPPATYLAREGERAAQCCVLVSGMAFRHKIAFSGARQIVSLHIPGEALDLQTLYLDCVDHNIQTLTHAELAVIPMPAIRQLIETRPAIAAGVIRALLVEASIQREWQLNIGRRTARERLAHLLCEYAFRIDAQGLPGNGHYELRMTQEQIADALGLTSVHVNRSLRGLEEEGLIAREGRSVSFPDAAKLRKAADFTELYLHGG